MAYKRPSTSDIPDYGTAVINGNRYYRTQIRDVDGKRVTLYADTPEELYEKEAEARKQIEEIIRKKTNPTVSDYCEKWLQMRAAKISKATLRGYTDAVNKYIVQPMGDMYMTDVTADDIKLALVAPSKLSSSVYNLVNMLVKSIFYSAVRSEVIPYNPAEGICAKGGTPAKKRDALTDEQVTVLLDTIRDLPPYLFTMIGLYAGLRREEILALQWDCVFLDVSVPYISVRRAWRRIDGAPEISTVLKTPAAKRDIPIPECLTRVLREAREDSNSDFVIANKDGGPLTEAQFTRMWKYVKVRTAEKRTYYKYVNGESIKYTVNPTYGGHQPNRPDIVYSLNFKVTPHMLRHTYITNLIYGGVDPKTVQYLAGHENSRTTMDIYAKVKYNKPEELLSVVNAAFQ